ncbi:MAG: FAD-dependent oxidoreductase, partial [Bacteroidota bacterium]|nr:FAD-dependent oxidoreductase [Bacteroidota bacterium]
MLSIWEKQSFLTYDYIVIGSGIVGLSTAISIKEKNKRASVLVLERGILPTGASTKNAGFACFGSFSELLVDCQIMGEDAAFQLVKDRWEGLMKLRERLGDGNIQFENYGGYEILSKGEEGILDQLHYVNNVLKTLFKKDVFVEDKRLISTFGLNPSKAATIISNPFEGQLDS